MADVTVPDPPPLTRVRNVELVHTGTWDISTGTFTFTVEDLAQAVAALDCPAVRRPILKLGHVPDPLPGQPAVGYVDNLATADAGRMLVGDYAGMPSWLATQDAAGDSVITSAYPDRSVEGEYDYRCQLGHLHPFVIHAVALLGQERPGVGTLQSLQDLADLYQVAAANPQPTGTPVAVTVHATHIREEPVPNPTPPQVAASVSTEDVRRAFYSSPAGQSWDIWIEEIQLDPELQLIAVNDATGDRQRIPVVLGDGEGEDAVGFGEPVTVLIRYEDAPAAEPSTANASTGGRSTIRYASRAESRPGARPAASDDNTPGGGESPPVEPAAGPTQPTDGGHMSDLDEGLRQRLGLDADADEATILAALDEALNERAEPPASSTEEGNDDTGSDADDSAAATPELPDGVTVIDQSTLDELRVAAEAGREASRRFAREDRDNAIAAAVHDGRIPPARREHWQTAWDADPDGTRQALATLAPGLVPVAAQGVPGGEQPAEEYTEFDQMHSPSQRAAFARVDGRN